MATVEQYDALCTRGEFSWTTTARLGSERNDVDVEGCCDEDIVVVVLALTHSC